MRFGGQLLVVWRRLRQPRTTLGITSTRTPIQAFSGRFGCACCMIGECAWLRPMLPETAQARTQTSGNARNCPKLRGIVFGRFLKCLKILRTCAAVRACWLSWRIPIQAGVPAAPPWPTRPVGKGGPRPQRHAEAPSGPRPSVDL
eukprot:8981347-Alexandrium_andersonii.AAC.1